MKCWERAFWQNWPFFRKDQLYCFFSKKPKLVSLPLGGILPFLEFFSLSFYFFDGHILKLTVVDWRREGGSSQPWTLLNMLAFVDCLLMAFYFILFLPIALNVAINFSCFFTTKIMIAQKIFWDCLFGRDSVRWWQPPFFLSPLSLFLPIYPIINFSWRRLRLVGWGFSLIESFFYFRVLRVHRLPKYPKVMN